MSKTMPKPLYGYTSDAQTLIKKTEQTNQNQKTRLDSQIIILHK